MKLSTQQEEILSKSYDWATNVIVRQQRFLPLDVMWTAYPFKKDGFSKEGLSIMLTKMQDGLIEMGNVEIPQPQKY
jgi:hypothetical protein